MTLDGRGINCTSTVGQSKRCKESQTKKLLVYVGSVKDLISQKQKE